MLYHYVHWIHHARPDARELLSKRDESLLNVALIALLEGFRVLERTAVWVCDDCASDGHVARSREAMLHP